MWSGHCLYPAVQTLLQPRTSSVWPSNDMHAIALGPEVVMQLYDVKGKGPVTARFQSPTVLQQSDQWIAIRMPACGSIYICSERSVRGSGDGLWGLQSVHICHASVGTVPAKAAHAVLPCSHEQSEPSRNASSWLYGAPCDVVRVSYAPEERSADRQHGQCGSCNQSFYTVRCRLRVPRLSSAIAGRYE